ncbi:hypothetical protein RRG08_042448 [Elysia crispata]|uniref:Uncharacterized protein n=1 Tax=Elysia crispata TaxID=231223 RepID=A0AAE0ZCB6_9GAST|nr:hypothetical protein RRG08_042448 [Elysia crispata]
MTFSDLVPVFSQLARDTTFKYNLPHWRPAMGLVLAEKFKEGKKGTERPGSSSSGQRLYPCAGRNWLEISQTGARSTWKPSLPGRARRRHNHRTEVSSFLARVPPTAESARLSKPNIYVMVFKSISCLCLSQRELSKTTPELPLALLVPQTKGHNVHVHVSKEEHFITGNPRPAPPSPAQPACTEPVLSRRDTTGEDQLVSEVAEFTYHSSTHNDRFSRRNLLSLIVAFRPCLPGGVMSTHTASPCTPAPRGSRDCLLDRKVNVDKLENSNRAVDRNGRCLGLLQSLLRVEDNWFFTELRDCLPLPGAQGVKGSRSVAAGERRGVRLTGPENDLDR